MRQLAPYQTEIARAVIDSVLHDRGLTITVEIARGAGARETAAQLEMLLLGLHVNDGVRLLRVGPAHGRPASGRLARHLRAGATRGLASVRGNVVRLGRAEVRYVTPTEALATPGPIGLLQVTNAEALGETELEPLVALAGASGATTVLYGTAWNGETGFEVRKQANRERYLESGARWHFRVPWQRAAEELPGYGERVEEARLRLGETNPEFQARYELLPAPAAGPLLPVSQHRSLDGDFPRRHAPTPGVPALASILITRLPTGSPRQDALARGATAVVTIAQPGSSALHVVEHRWLEAVDALALAEGIAGVVGETWHCDRVVADAPHADAVSADAFRHLLARALGSSRQPWADDTDVSARAFGLMAALHAGCIRLYQPDGSAEYRILRHEIESATARFEAGGRATIELPPPDEGFVRGLALLTGLTRTATGYERELTPALAS